MRTSTRIKTAAIAAALATLIQVQEAEVLGERVQVGPEHGVVDPGAAVEDDEGRPLAELLDVEADAVGQIYAHPPAIAATTRISSPPSRGVSTPSRMRMSCRST